MNYDKFISPAVKGLKPSGIRRFFDLVASTEGVISLGVGEPDFVTPDNIRKAAIDSINAGMTTYTSNYGTMELREAVARYLDEQYSIRYNPANEIVITVGTSEAMDITLRTLVSPGDEVLVPEPCYVSYEPGISLCGGKTVYIHTRDEDRFKLTPELLRAAITENTKVLIVPYPSNPTGAIMTREELEEVAAIAIEHDLVVISDEIYSELTYNGLHHVSIASLPGMWERTIVINGLSKGFAMTGWRVGYVCGPVELIGQMLKIHQYTMLCAPIMSQVAAVEALENSRDSVKYMVEQYDIRRKYLVKRFNEIGLTCFEAEGAFYLFPSIAITGMDENDFAERLLEEESVAVVPGSAFGPSGAGHLRISYAYSMENLKEALNRIERFVEKHRNDR